MNIDYQKTDRKDQLELRIYDAVCKIGNPSRKRGYNLTLNHGARILLSRILQTRIISSLSDFSSSGHLVHKISVYIDKEFGGFIYL